MSSLRLMHLNGILSAFALAALLSACGGSAPAVSADPAQGQTQEVKPVEEPKMTEEQAQAKATDVKSDALALEEENHKLRQEIYETKVKLGMEVDSGIPETTADKPAAAPADTKAAAPAKPASKSTKKKGK